MHLTLVTDHDHGGDKMRGEVPPKTAAKIRELAAVLASVVVALDPAYDFSESNLANSELSITDIRCRAAALSRAWGSMRRNSTSC